MDQSANRGVKRKRYEPPQEEMSVRVGGKLHHEMKEVHKASKKAKVFETQKVVKRLKDIRKKDESDKSIAEFEAELNTLKEIDHDAIGNSALRSKVLKDHTLRDNDDIKTAMKKELEGNLFAPGAPGTALAKIQSRLLSSKILATQVSASIVALKVLLNPALKQRDNATSIKSDPAQSSDRPSKTRKTSASHDGPTASKCDGALMELNEEADEDEDENEEDAAIDEAGWESGSVGEDGVNDDGWESGSIGSGRSGVSNSEDSDEESDEDSDSGDEELRVKPIQPTDSKPPKRAAAGTAKPAASASKMESTFLPSLSVGFVRGSDDSDFSEAEDAAADMPKKNRRGQRARQAIWEKKYGRNANHKKKEAEALAATQKKNNRHARPINTGPNALPTGQAPPGAARAQAQAGRGKAVAQQHQPVDDGWAGRAKGASGGSKVVSKPTAKPDTKEQKLHPSWEAKRRLKEKESVGIVPSQGKKIKFT